jgi:hypothetical protein
MIERVNYFALKGQRERIELKRGSTNHTRSEDAFEIVNQDGISAMPGISILIHNFMITLLKLTRPSRVPRRARP